MCQPISQGCGASLTSSSSSLLLLPLNKMTVRLSSQLKQRSMPLALKYTLEPSTHKFKLSPRVRSNRHLRLIVACASNHKNNFQTSFA